MRVVFWVQAVRYDRARTEALIAVPGARNRRVSLYVSKETLERVSGGGDGWLVAATLTLVHQVRSQARRLP